MTSVTDAGFHAGINISSYVATTYMNSCAWKSAVSRETHY
jgi:hypothetical protein